MWIGILNDERSISLTIAAAARAQFTRGRANANIQDRKVAYQHESCCAKHVPVTGSARVEPKCGGGHTERIGTRGRFARGFSTYRAQTTLNNAPHRARNPVNPQHVAHVMR